MDRAEIRKLATLEDTHWWYRERRHLIAREVRHMRPGRALDIGATSAAKSTSQPVASPTVDRAGTRKLAMTGRMIHTARGDEPTPFLMHAPEFRYNRRYVPRLVV